MIPTKHENIGSQMRRKIYRLTLGTINFLTLLGLVPQKVTLASI